MLKNKKISPLIFLGLFITFIINTAQLPYISVNRYQKQRESLVTEDIIIDINKISLNIPDIITNIMEYLPGKSKTLNYLVRSKFCSNKTIEAIAKEILDTKNLIDIKDISRFLDQHYNLTKNNLKKRLKNELIEQLSDIDNIIKYTSQKKNTILNRNFNKLELHKCIKSYKYINKTLIKALKILAYQKIDGEISRNTYKKELLNIKLYIEKIIKSTNNNDLVIAENQLTKELKTYATFYFLSLAVFTAYIINDSYYEENSIVLNFCDSFLKSIIIFPITYTIIAITVAIIMKRIPTALDSLVITELSWSVDQIIQSKYILGIFYMLKSLKYIQLIYEDQTRKELIKVNKEAKAIKSLLESQLH